MDDFLIHPRTLPARSQRFALCLMQMLGWRLRFQPLPGPRGVMVVYPHTSNWDFFIGVLARMALGYPFYFIAKSSLFEGLTGATIGRIVRACGGEPIERSVSTGAIARLAERIRKSEEYWLAVTPEGTRSYRPYWRSGFYHIARAADVPVGCARFDFARKEIAIVDYVHLSGNVEDDLQRIRACFEGVRGCHSERAGAIAFKEEAPTS